MFLLVVHTIVLSYGWLRGGKIPTSTRLTNEGRHMHVATIERVKGVENPAKEWRKHACQQRQKEKKCLSSETGHGGSWTCHSFLVTTDVLVVQMQQRGMHARHTRGAAFSLRRMSSL
jgi:hypothetical protein